MKLWKTNLSKSLYKNFKFSKENFIHFRIEPKFFFQMKLSSSKTDTMENKAFDWKTFSQLLRDSFRDKKGLNQSLGINIKQSFVLNHHNNESI